jgi:hypothetical protein
MLPTSIFLSGRGLQDKTRSYRPRDDHEVESLSLLDLSLHIALQRKFDKVLVRFNGDSRTCSYRPQDDHESCSLRQRMNAACGTRMYRPQDDPTLAPYDIIILSAIMTSCQYLKRLYKYLIHKSLNISRDHRRDQSLGRPSIRCRPFRLARLRWAQLRQLGLATLWCQWCCPWWRWSLLRMQLWPHLLMKCSWL